MLTVNGMLARLARPPFLRRFFWVALVVVGVMLPTATVAQRSLRNTPNPLAQGLGGRLDDISYWNMLAVCAAAVLTMRSHATIRRRSLAGCRGFSYHRFEGRPSVFVEGVLILQVATWLLVSALSRDNLFRWLDPSAGLIETLLQALEGVFVLMFIVVAVSLLYAHLRTIRWAHYLRRRGALDKRTWFFAKSTLLWTGPVFSLFVSAIWFGVYVEMLVPAIRIAWPAFPPPNTFVLGNSNMAVKLALILFNWALYGLSFLVAFIYAWRKLGPL